MIDCGLSGKQVELRLAEFGIDPASLSALVVTHEHRDHIQGISVLSRRYRLPVYCNRATAEFIDRVHGFEYFDTGEFFSIGSVRLHPFSIVHDAVDPVGFEVLAEGLKLAHVTDLGRATALVKMALTGAHAVVLEANYDRELLQTCDYPWQLKQRIASSHGHLGNIEAARSLKEMLHGDLVQVVLAHLSENSNSPTHALQSMYAVLPPLMHDRVVCGTPAKATELFRVEPAQVVASVA